MLVELVLAAFLQSAIVSNPRAVEFECADHGSDTGHEIDILDSANVVIQTIQGGDPAPIGIQNGLPLVRISINVQPIAFGNYTVKVRAVAGTLKSVDSLPASFTRVPGQPTNVKVGG
jgi:hypothetical protein